MAVLLNGCHPIVTSKQGQILLNVLPKLIIAAGLVYDVLQ